MRALSLALSFTALSLLTSLPTPSAALDLPDLLKNGGLRVEDSSGRVVLSYRDEDPFIPASTLKVATSFCALEELGGDYHFITELYEGPGHTLYIKGSGDPSLVSEELARMARVVASKMPTVDRIVVDTSLFAPGILIDGASLSTNPYDARSGAFIGNFSTAFLTRSKNGAVTSAEPQTPLTPLARAAAIRIGKGTTERINIGHEERDGALYAGELLAEFLNREQGRSPRSIEIGTTPPTARLIERYQSTQPLREMIQGLLKYSTNFTANQIFLTLGRERFGAPATVEKGKRALTQCLENRAGWRGFNVEEGAGLSRRNSVTAHLMTRLLGKFKKYSELLADEDGFHAKTGSLTGVNTLVGYFSTPSGETMTFAILVNSAVPHLYKFKVARDVRNYLSKGAN